MGWVYLHADTDWVSTVFRRNISIISLNNIQGKTEMSLSQIILLRLSKASCSRRRPPGYICSRLTLLVVIFRKCFASYFTVFNCYSPGDHDVSYHLKKVGWFQVE